MHRPEPKLLKAPTKEPVSLNEAKLHRRIDTSADDVIVSACVEAARKQAENVTWKQYVLATYVQYFDLFPTVIKLNRPPVRQVVSVKYIDNNGTEQTVSSTNYHVDLVSEPARICLADGFSWPTTDDRPNAVYVEYKAGYLVPVTVDTTNDRFTNSDHPFNNGDVTQLYVSGNQSKAAPGGLEEASNYYVVGSTTSYVQLSATSGGSAIDITSDGTGEMFLGQIPPNERAAIWLLTGHFYENRETVMVANGPLNAVALPYGAEQLLMSSSVRVA